jgi:hypothetical protein
MHPIETSMVYLPFHLFIDLGFVKVAYSGGRCILVVVARESAQKKFVQFIAIGGEKVNVCCTRCISKNGINFQKSKKNICAMYTQRAAI